MRGLRWLGFGVLVLTGCGAEAPPTISPPLPLGPITSPASGSVWVVGDTTPLVGDGLLGWSVFGGELLSEAAVVWTTPGAGRVTARSGDTTQSVDVLIQPVTETTLLPGVLTPELAVGDSVALSARVLDQRGREMPRPVTWTSVRGRLVVQGSWARAAGLGTDTLVATAGQLTIRRPIVVRSAPLQVAASATNIVWGDTVFFRATSPGESVTWRLLSSETGGILEGSVFRPLAEPFTATGGDAPWMAAGLVVEGCRGGSCDTARVNLRRARVDPAMSRLVVTGGDTVGDRLVIGMELRDSTGALIPGRHLYGGQHFVVESGSVIRMHRSATLVPSAPGAYQLRAGYTEGAAAVFERTHQGVAGSGVVQGDGDGRPFLVQFGTPVSAQGMAALAAGAARLNALTAGSSLGRTFMAAAAGSCWTGSPEIVARPIGIIVQVLVIPLDGTGGAGAGAKVCYSRESSTPLLGLVIFDEADFGSTIPWHEVPDVMIHELIHAAGLTTHGPAGRGLAAGMAGNDPRFIGPAATAAYMALGGSNQGVPLNNIGGPGVGLSHTRDAVFYNEITNAFSGNRIGTITGGILRDLGFVVNGSLPASLLSGPAIARTAPTWFEFDPELWVRP